MENKSITLNQLNIIGEKIDIDIERLEEDIEIEDIVIKNFDVDNKLIGILNSMKKLKKAWFINCKFINDIKLKNINSLKLENCNKINVQLLENSIKHLYIIECKEIDIEKIKHLDLITLGLEKEDVKNLKMIEQFENLENLYLQEIDLNDNINYLKLNKLKRVNFNGSKVEDKNEFIEKFKDRNIEISFMDKNLKIG